MFIRFKTFKINQSCLNKTQQQKIKLEMSNYLKTLLM